MSNSWWLKPAQVINSQVREEALARQQQLTKPAGSLGQLEIGRASCRERVS